MIDTPATRAYLQELFDLVITLTLAEKLNPQAPDVAVKRGLAMVRKRIRTHSGRYITKRASRNPYNWLKQQQAMLGDTIYCVPAGSFEQLNEALKNAEKVD